MIESVTILNSLELGHPETFTVGEKTRRGEVKRIALFKKEGNNEVVIFFDEGKKVIYHDVPFVTYHKPTEYKEEVENVS